MKKIFFATMVVIALFFANFTGMWQDRVSSAEAATALNLSNMPDSIIGGPLAAAALTKGSDIVPLNDQSNMPQLTSDGHVLGFKPTKAYFAAPDHALLVEFLGTKGVMPETADTKPATGTLSGAPTLSWVLYQNLWEGISLTYESTPHGITESTYRIAPGADVSQIRLRYNVPVLAQKDGSLKFTFETGYLTESKPIAWQQINGKRRPVTVAFKVSGDEVGFSVGDYNPREPLIIDPIFAWHTFYGSSAWDYGWGIAVDASDNVYITGYSHASWGTPLNAHSGSQDLFVLKLNASGAYQWHTFYGPCNSDSIWAAAFIAVDASGNVYVTGEGTASWGSPLNAYSGNADVLILKLNTNGAYQWHTFYGSSGKDVRPCIVADASGNVYVTGESSESWGSPLHAKSGSQNLFVLKLDASGAYQWHTFYGYSDGDWGSGIALDANGNVYVTAGSSASWGSPLNGFSGGSSDAYVLKLNDSGAYQWHTYHGGGGYDAAYGIVVDASGGIYITGRAGGGRGSSGGDIAVLKLDDSGAYQWHTLLGSSDYDSGYWSALDSSGNVYVVAESWNTWGDPLNAYSGDADVVLLKLDPSGTYQWHTFLGEWWDDWPTVIVMDSNNNAYVTGTMTLPWGDPLHAHSGDYDILVLKFNDSSGGDNRAPVLNAIGNKSVAEGAELTFTVTATDPDGDDLTYSASNLPAEADFDPATQIFTWTPAFGEAGNYPNVLFTVTDNGVPSQSASEAITITVGDVNRAPVLNAIGNKSVAEGAELTFTVTATDPDGDDLTYSASNLPAEADFDPATQIFTWTPAFGEAGNYPNVLFTVTDNGVPSQSASEAITITVGDVNRAPVLNAIGNKSVAEGAELTFTVTATDPDGDDLTYSASNLPAEADFDPATQIFTWTPAFGEAGNYPNVLFTVTDNGVPSQSASEAITITVGDVNRAPVLNAIGNKSVAEGAELTFTVTATDPDGDDLTYSASNLPAEADFDPATQIFTWTPAFGEAGNYPNVLFTVTDNGVPSQSASEAITITVGDVNRAPVLNAIGNKSVAEGAELTFTVTATDPDGDDLTYSASNLPAEADFDPATQIFTWTPAFGEAGNYPNVLFTVTDNGVPSQSASEAITITVGDVNSGPGAYQWHTFYGSLDGDYGFATAVDASGNVYVTGYSNASWGTPLHAHSGSRDLFVLKLNASGAYQWHTFYGPSDGDYGFTAASIAIDASGNVYVTGESWESWGTPLHAYSGDADIFVLKLNASGAYQWHTFYGSSDYDSRSAIAVDASGNIYVSGESSASWGSPLHAKSSSQNLFVLKLNASGAYQWHTFYGLSDGAFGSRIAVDMSGNVYSTAGSSASWGSPLSAYSGNTDAFVLKLNASGAYQWHTFHGGGGYDAAYGIAVDMSGNVYITGTLSRDLAVLKLSASGAYQWHSLYGSSDYDSGYGIAIDASGNVYVTGESWASWGDPLHAYSGDADVFILKLDDSGVYQWHTFYGSGGYADFGTDIAVDAGDNIHVTGGSYYSWGDPLKAHSGDYDVFVMKLNE